MQKYALGMGGAWYESLPRLIPVSISKVLLIYTYRICLGPVCSILVCVQNNRNKSPLHSMIHTHRQPGKYCCLMIWLNCHICDVPITRKPAQGGGLEQDKTDTGKRVKMLKMVSKLLTRVNGKHSMHKSNLISAI